MIISATALSSYLYCPRKLFLEKVLGFVEIPKEAVVKGSVRHEVFDRINREEERIVTSIAEPELGQIREEYIRSYSRILKEVLLANKDKLKKQNIASVSLYRESWPALLFEAEERSQIVYDFMRQEQLVGIVLWEKLYPKIVSEVGVTSEELQMRGIIDKLLVYSDAYVPYELKTGSAPHDGVWPGHRIQIACYMLLVSEKFGVPAKKGYITYLDVHESRPVSMNPFLKAEVLELITAVQALLSSFEIPEVCESKNKCNQCNLLGICKNSERICQRIDEVRLRKPKYHENNPSNQTQNLNIT